MTVRPESVDRQQALLTFIVDTVETRGFPPSVREAATQLGISPPSALRHLEALEEQGFIERVAKVPRGIRVLKQP